MIKNKRIGILTIVAICLIGLVGIGVSYAYWRFTYMQTDKNIGISKCLTISLSEENNEINLNNIYPISDEEGRNLTPYSFKLTNTCSMSAEYLLNLEMLEGTTLNSKYLDVLVNNGDINLLSSFDNASTVITNSVESITLVKDILTPGASKEYTISIWIDKNVTISDDAQNKDFKGKVVVNATAISTIVDKIVAQLDTTGKCPTINSDSTVNVTGPESENSLLCSAPDNYGTSYYYRGNVENNYVKFANFYWRIVRINGDGSIRLIYDGTVAHQNDEASEDRIIGKSAFNEKSDDNAYVGYMYGTPGSSTYEETHANINDSTIKKYIDNWYENNLKDTKYEKYLADNIFCNDRNISQSTDSNYNNFGYAKNNTKYRWNTGPWTKHDMGMIFKCINKNDNFTSNDTLIGNGNLKYPIGLLSHDEVLFAGGYNNSNLSYYLYTGTNWWTMSANDFYSNMSYVRSVYYKGDAGNYRYAVDNSNDGVKTVINLKPNSLKSGDGTINNPYTVE